MIPIVRVYPIAVRMTRREFDTILLLRVYRKTVEMEVKRRYLSVGICYFWSYLNRNVSKRRSNNLFELHVYVYVCIKVLHTSNISCERQLTADGIRGKLLKL